MSHLGTGHTVTAFGDHSLAAQLTVLSEGRDPAGSGIDHPEASIQWTLGEMILQNPQPGKAPPAGVVQAPWTPRALPCSDADAKNLAGGQTATGPRMRQKG